MTHISPTANAQDVTAKHTPGPWLRIDTADYAEIHAQFRPSSQAVALVGKPADADLIAAAPDLLAACVAILEHTHITDSDPADWEPSDHVAESAVRAAIAKATAA